MGRKCIGFLTKYCTKAKEMSPNYTKILPKYNSKLLSEPTLSFIIQLHHSTKNGIPNLCKATSQLAGP